MDDREVGALWRELTTGLHDCSLTNDLRRNKWKDRIRKLVEERKQYHLRDYSQQSQQRKSAQDCCLVMALLGFDIDPATWPKEWME